MKHTIKHRFTGKPIYTAEINCPEDTPENVKLGLAVRAAAQVCADLSYADLREADLTKADLRGANLSGANLSYADLRYANPRGVDLSGAVGLLSLPVAELRHYRHVAVWHGEWIIFAGCRRYTIAQASKHWLSENYKGPASVHETYGAALEWLEKQEGPLE
jgi:hypothetical protein